MYVCIYTYTIWILPIADFRRSVCPVDCLSGFHVSPVAGTSVCQPQSHSSCWYSHPLAHTSLSTDTCIIDGLRHCLSSSWFLDPLFFSCVVHRHMRMWVRLSADARPLGLSSNLLGLVGPSSSQNSDPLVFPVCRPDFWLFRYLAPKPLILLIGWFSLTLSVSFWCTYHTIHVLFIHSLQLLVLWTHECLWLVVSSPVADA